MSAAAQQCICLTAPTASGKTALALRLAERFPIEIVSMDSAMVYRGMDIGTAKPSQGERSRAPHHLIDIRDPVDAYSAGQFIADAVSAIRDIRGRGNCPLVVGGTMLYLKALKGGLAELPKADAEIREAIDHEADRYGWPALHERLAEVDREAAMRIAPNDRQRIQRALEVYRLTGTPLTVLQKACSANSVDVHAIALLPGDRAGLSKRIERRFDAMLAEGLVAEVEALRSRGDLDASVTSMRSVGYRQIWSYLEGIDEFSIAREKAIVATRQLAKRQLTWLRSGLADETVQAGTETTESEIFSMVDRQVAERV